MHRRPAGAALAAVVLALTSAGAAVLVAPVAAHAAAGDPVRTAQRCNPDRYRDHYTAVTKGKKPTVTHLHAFSMPPSASHTVTKTATLQTVLRARIKYNSEVKVSVSAAKKILAAAEASARMELAASGSRTASRSVTVTDTIANKTRHNAQYVFFRGNMTASGSYRHYYCSMYYTPTGNVGYFVHYRPGSWRSYAVYSDGAARCGAGGTVNAVTKAALAAGC
jgi:hypothetical protein